MTNLELCLRELTFDTLVSFLPSQSVAFVDSLGLFDEQEAPLARAVSVSSAAHFIYDKMMRDKLIRSIKRDTFAKIFGSIFDDVSKIDKGHYDALIEWVDNANNLGRFAALLGVPELYTTTGERRSAQNTVISVKAAYGLYPYQQEISDKAVNSLTGKTRLVIHLPTGAGKTRTGMDIVVRHLRASASNLVLWLADREELCEQAMTEFQKAWSACGNRDTKAYGYYASSNESLSGIDSGIIVGSLQAMNIVRNNDSERLELIYNSLRKKVTLVVFDEAHKAVAGTYAAVVNDFVSSGDIHADLIGLTATPGRKVNIDQVDEENSKLSEFFNHNKITMEVRGYLSPIDYLVKNGYLAKVNFKRLDYPNGSSVTRTLIDKAETYNELATSVDRNRLIIDTIADEVSNNKQVIVFACSVEHARNLSVALNCCGIKSASIDGEDDPIARRLRISRYKNGELRVLLNYGVLTAGFDAPRTSVSVIARPTGSLVEYLQMAGRAMRGKNSGGNEECTVYNVDDGIEIFNSMPMAFRHWDKGWDNTLTDELEQNDQGQPV